MLGCMAESFKVMVWLVLLVIIFIYFYSLLLTELIWETCPNEKTAEVCKKFGDLLSSQMTLYQIMYSGLLWGDLWEELRVMDWYIQIIFLSYVVFALMVFLESVCTFFLITFSLLFLITHDDGFLLKLVVGDWSWGTSTAPNIAHTWPQIGAPMKK